MATSLSPTLAILWSYTVWMSTASRLCSTCSISARCTGRPDSWTQCSWVGNRGRGAGGRVVHQNLPSLYPRHRQPRGSGPHVPQRTGPGAGSEPPAGWACGPGRAGGGRRPQGPRPAAAPAPASRAPAHSAPCSAGSPRRSPPGRDGRVRAGQPWAHAMPAGCPLLPHSVSPVPCAGHGGGHREAKMMALGLCLRGA